MKSVFVVVVAACVVSSVIGFKTGTVHKRVAEWTNAAASWFGPWFSPEYPRTEQFQWKKCGLFQKVSKMPSLTICS